MYKKYFTRVLNNHDSSNYTDDKHRVIKMFIGHSFIQLAFTLLLFYFNVLY